MVDLDANGRVLRAEQVMSDAHFGRVRIGQDTMATETTSGTSSTPTPAPGIESTVHESPELETRDMLRTDAPIPMTQPIAISPAATENRPRGSGTG